MTPEKGDLLLVEVHPPLLRRDYIGVLRQLKGRAELVDKLFGSEADFSRFVLAPRIKGMRLLPTLNMEQGSVFMLLPESWLCWSSPPFFSLMAAEIRLAQ
jgi:hypothetical protein